MTGTVTFASSPFPTPIPIGIPPAPSTVGFVGLVGQFGDVAFGPVDQASVALTGFFNASSVIGVGPFRAAGVPSPVFFAGVSTLPLTGGPITGLTGQLSFQLGGNDTILLPSSADISVQVVPEPSALILLGSGLVSLIIYRRVRLSVRA